MSGTKVTTGIGGIAWQANHRLGESVKHEGPLLVESVSRALAIPKEEGKEVQVLGRVSALRVLVIASGMADHPYWRLGVEWGQLEEVGGAGLKA